MKPNFNFVLYLSIVMGVMLILTTACPDVDSEPEPTCTDAIQNGNETGVDCGGDCPPCFECLTNYCTLISGATSIESKTNFEWIGILSNNNPIEGSWTFNIFSTGIFYENWEGEKGNGSWEFDNPSSPTKFIVTYTNKPDGWPSRLELPLDDLTTDTLKLEDRMSFNVTFVKE